jgi:hypothetical protein
MADESIEQTFSASGGQVWAALEAAITELRYEVKRCDSAARTVEFNTGFSWSSWKGQDMEAVVRELTPGSTQLSLTGSLALKVQLTSWGEKKRIARKVLARVERQVGPTPAR